MTVRLIGLIAFDLVAVYITLAVALALIWSGVWYAVIIGLLYVAADGLVIRQGLRVSDSSNRHRGLHRAARNVAILHVVLLPIAIVSYGM